jgi:ABC-type phosphate transport system permease subunit
MVAPWIIDAMSRLAGVDVYGVKSFYIPFFYAMSDQIGASVSGFLFLRSRSASTGEAMRSYLRHPVMVAGLAVILAVPVGLVAARLLGFSPSTQVLTAIETIVANLCWVPPLVGWLMERRRSVRR